jgi:hypothetical protein
MEQSELIDNGRKPLMPEVPEKPVRRRYTVEDKSRILDEADACTEKGQLGELLRREGYLSTPLAPFSSPYISPVSAAASQVLPWLRYVSARDPRAQKHACGREPHMLCHKNLSFS